MRLKVLVGHLFVILLLLACNISSPSLKVLTTTTSENSTQAITPTTGDEKPLVTDEATTSVPALNTPGLIQPSDLKYVGAIRLPGGEDRPKTFAYGGNAIIVYTPIDRSVCQ